MKHPRITSADMWAALATGKPDAATLAWAAGVAGKVLAANRLTNANQRRLAMMRAVDLTGRGSHDQSTIRMLAAIPDAAFGGGPPTEAERRKRLRDLVAAVFALDGISDEALDGRIRRALKD